MENSSEGRAYKRSNLFVNRQMALAPKGLIFIRGSLRFSVLRIIRPETY